MGASSATRTGATENGEPGAATAARGRSAAGTALGPPAARSGLLRLPGVPALADRVAVYARPMDACEVDGEVVEPQPGGFYGGWITSTVAGPFKGVPGSMGW